MTKRNWLGFISAAMLAVGACGSEDPGECLTHGCPGLDSPFLLTEGGEYRFESIEARADADGDGTFEDASYLAGQAFFFNGQAEPRGLDGVPLTLPAGIENVIACGDYTAGTFFDNGNTPDNQALVDARNYFDVGPSVTITSENDTVFTLDKQLDAIDLSAGLQHDIVYRFDDPSTLEYNTFYSPQLTFPEGVDVQGFELVDGETPQGQKWADEGGEEVIYVPPKFTFTELNGQPLADADFLEAGVTLVPGQDNTFTWTNEERPNAEAPSNLAFIGFYDLAGQVDYYCYNPDGQDDGAITIPADVIDRIDPDGALLVGKFVHMAWVNVVENNRIDFLGVSCKFGPYTKAAP
jgi:hypothetical protein